VKLQKKQWRDDLKRLKEIKKRGKDSINDYHDTREDEVPTPVLIPLPDFVLRVEGWQTRLACMTVSVKLD
jgi:hypothetical protein